jgi:hypothetical protein
LLSIKFIVTEIEIKYQFEPPAFSRQERIYRLLGKFRQQELISCREQYFFLFRFAEKQRCRLTSGNLPKPFEARLTVDFGAPLKFTFLWFYAKVKTCKRVI